MNNLLKYRNMIAVEDQMIPALPLLQLIEMYKLMGREKDMVKIETIEQFLANS
jgi:hypothetical protein